MAFDLDLEDDASTKQYKVTRDELVAFVERIERLMVEVSAAQTDVKEVYAEAKGRGYDAKALRALIARRKKLHADAEGLREHEAILELYREAIGDL